MQMKNMIAKWWRKFISQNWNSMSLMTLLYPLVKIQNNRNSIKFENSPQTPTVSQTVVKTKNATNQYISVGDRRDFGPLKSGSYWYFSPVYTHERNTISSFDWEIPELHLDLYIFIELTICIILCSICWKQTVCVVATTTHFAKWFFYYFCNRNSQIDTNMFLTRRTTLLTNHNKLKWFAFNKEANAYKTMFSICFENVLRTYCIYIN